MQKSKTFKNSRFKAEVLKEAISKAQSLREDGQHNTKFTYLIVDHDESRWHHDNIDEFYSDYRKYNKYSWILCYIKDICVNIIFNNIGDTELCVSCKNRSEIEEIFEIFEKNAEIAKIQISNSQKLKKPAVFIGHGRNKIWRDLKEHLQDKHGFTIEAYETGARTGHAIRDILEDMVEKSKFAVLILTAEDEQSDGQLRARQNVIHEAGLFQGRLGFSRAILIIEEGVEELSNFDGIQHIKFAKGNIKEVYGEVLATIRREFPN
jgi:predicted nucleotide-binding protein